MSPTRTSVTKIECEKAVVLHSQVIYIAVGPSQLSYKDMSMATARFYLRNTIKVVSWLQSWQ